MRARVTALVTGLLALAALVAAVHSPKAEAQAATLRARGQASLSNSKNGSAILGGRLGPGDSLSGTVTVGNVGSVAGNVTLTMADLADTPGIPRPTLSGKLALAVDDITGAAPVSIYHGPLGSLSPTALGIFRPTTARTYRFTVSWADGGAADSAYAGSSVKLEFVWSTGRASHTTTPPPPPPPPTAPSKPRLAGPTLSFRAAGRQRVIKRRATYVYARCDQACTVTVAAQLGMRHPRKAVTLRGTRRTLAAGVDSRLEMKLPGAVLQRLRTALRQHRRPVLRLTATANAPSGAAPAVKLNVRVIG